MEHSKSGAKKTLVQFVKFNIVGVMNTLIDFLVFQALNLLLGWTYIAQVISYTCGLVNSYIFFSAWTFKEERTRSAREMGLFVLVNVASLGVSLLVIYLCRNAFGVTDAWVAGWVPGFLSRFVKGDTVCKLIATPCAILVNYIGNRCFVFRKEGKREGA